jgi:hypothetical protein
MISLYVKRKNIVDEVGDKMDSIKREIELMV